LIADRDISNIIWRTNADFKFYPIDMVPADNTQRLEGFEWFGERRPMSKEDVCDRIERPSQIEEYRKIEKPTFPISLRINDHKQTLMKNTRWRDRRDALTTNDREYIREILEGTDLQ
jgi:hypothetical protein